MNSGTPTSTARAEALDAAVEAKQPLSAMEIGSYCGYTAVRMGRKIPAGGKLISVEIDPLYAAIATKARARPSMHACRRATPPLAAARTPLHAPFAPISRSGRVMSRH
jgi:predicted O-methyltransferase YrrM